MLNIITQVGAIVSEEQGEDPLSVLVPDQNTYRHLVGVYFDTKSGKVDFKLVKEAGAQSTLSTTVLQEYVFTGAEKGYRPQFAPTSDNLAYLLSQTLPNLRDLLPEGPLKQTLKKTVDIFFERLPAERGKKPAHLLRQTALPFPVPEELESETRHKDRLKQLAAVAEKEVLRKFAAKKNEVLYTVLVDENPIAKDRAYRQFLLQKNLESAFEKVAENLCSVCGKRTTVTQDTTRFLFKFYMTDKLNFASFFDNANFYKAVALCPDCYRRWLYGERWISKHLQTRLGGFNLYILPELVGPSPSGTQLLTDLEELPRQFSEIANFSELLQREKKVVRHLKHESPFIWNFLFYRKAQSAFKVLLLIRDVPPTRIQQIFRALSAVEEDRSKHFPEYVRFDLSQIYWIVPLRMSQGEHHEYRKLLQIYHDIFTGVPFRAAPLHRFFVDLARVHYFSSYGRVQIKRGNTDPLFSLARDTVKWNLFFQFLKKLDLLKGEKAMASEEQKGSMPEELERIFETLQYTPAQQGLALLGYVIGVIANAQWKEGLQNKPVLDKISYQGMSPEKTLRLFADAFEKLRQYRRHAQFAEPWLATATSLYQLGKGHERMSSDERLFYLLSGYAFQVVGATRQPSNESELKEEETA